MTLTAKLKWDLGPLSTSDPSPTGSGTLSYWVHSDNLTDTRLDVLDWMPANCPTSLFGYLRDNITVNGLVHENTNTGYEEQIWDVDVKYKSSSGKTPAQLDSSGNSGNGEVRLSVRSGGGGQMNMLYSRSLIQEQAENATWAFSGNDKLKRLLNIQGENDPESGRMFTVKGISMPVGSVEIVAEQKSTNEKVIEDSRLITSAYYASVHVVNSVAYKGFPAGALRLTNFSATQEGGSKGRTGTPGSLPASDDNVEDWDLTYTFEYQPTVTAAELNSAARLPPGMTGPLAFTQDKKGWHYLDVTFVDEKVNFAAGIDFIIPQAKRMAIQEVWEELNFATGLFI